MKNDGKSSQKIFETKIRARYGKTAFLYRLDDAADLTGLNRGLTRNSKALVATKKLASDYIATTPPDGMHYAEVKSSQNPTSFPFSQFEEGQWQAMRMQKAAHGEYWAYLHNLNTDIWYKVPAWLILYTKDSGTSSLKWKDLNNYVWRL